jgi:hypothetical protein
MSLPFLNLEQCLRKPARHFQHEANRGSVIKEVKQLLNLKQKAPLDAKLSQHHFDICIAGRIVCFAVVVAKMQGVRFP